LGGSWLSASAASPIRSGGDGKLFHLHDARDLLFECFYIEWLEISDQAVRGENKQTIVLHADQNEHAKVGGMGRGKFAAVLCGDFGLVLEGGGVAVMTIGDVHGPVLHQIDHLVFDLGVSDAPQIALHSFEGAGEFGLAGVLVKEVGDVVAGIAVQAEDGGELHAGGAHEFEPVFDGAFVGFFVGNDFTLSEGGKADQGDEAAAVKRAAVMLVGLGIGVKGPAAVTLKNARTEPRLHRNVGAIVDFIGSDGFGRKMGQIDIDDVMGVVGLKLGPAGFIKHVVRRGD